MTSVIFHCSEHTCDNYYTSPRLTVPVDALVGFLAPLHAMVDHSGHSQRPRIPTQESDIVTSGQTLEAVADVLQSSLEEGLLPEDIVEVQVEQSDACEETGGNENNWNIHSKAARMSGIRN